MRAAVLTTFGAPTVAQFPEPEPVEGSVVVDVLAAAVNGVDRAIAGGRHFLSPRALPVVAGRDGVGTTPEGRLVYFDGPRAPHGSMAERTSVDPSTLIDVPAGADPAVAAALGNAGLAGWLPLAWRARVQPGETVVVLGSGGVVGSIAVQAARLLGAGRVVGVDRGADALRRTRDLGADDAVDTTGMAGDELTHALGRAVPDGIDVVIDYAWGHVALSALRNAALGARLVQVGTVVSDDLTLSGELLRAKSIDVLGYVSFRAPLDVRTAAYRRLVQAATAGELRVPVDRQPLDEVERVWTTPAASGAGRPVLIP
jgi:NADPH2:quinone reductase